jgi:DNA-binding IclR family transcriptional regulator
MAPASSLTDAPYGGGHTPPTGTEAAARVADVLLLLADGSVGGGVSDLARRLGISKTVVHRILQSLASRGLVVPDPRRRTYALGPAAAALGVRALRELDLRREALPVLRRLQHETGETTTVSALVGSVRVYLDQVVSLQEVKMTVELGRPAPLHAGASSKVVLAFAPDDLRERVLAGPLPPLTERTVVDRERLAAELARIREDGVAATLGERQSGAGSVAAPVIGADGAVAGAISVCGPLTRFTPAVVERYRPLVRAAGEEVSERLRRGALLRGGGEGDAHAPEPAA